MSDDQAVLPPKVTDYHARQAAHLRELAENATTPWLKTRLLNEAQWHDEHAAIKDEQALIERIAPEVSSARRVWWSVFLYWARQIPLTSGAMPDQGCLWCWGDSA